LGLHIQIQDDPPNINAEFNGEGTSACTEGNVVYT